ncbi:MAG: hypothetical protein K8F91_23940, partial [Candidatus Obscuribacterales bacterium]|nr:hypothetical protein [Candidatus Obscuribacterales bacterium]
MVLRSSTGVASHWKRGQAASSPTEAGKTAGITSSSGIQNSGSFAQGYQSLSRGLTSGSNNVAPDTSQFQAGQAQTSPQLQTGISVQNQVVETPVATAPPIATPLKQALNLEDAYRAAQAGATIAQAARGFRGGVKSGIANIIGAAQQLGAQNAANNAYVANRAISPVMPSVIPPGKNAGLSSVFGGGGFSQSMPSGGSSYSDMRKAFNQQQLSALPPAMAVSVNPQGDETAEYGLATYESRAFGAVRINRLSTVHGSEELAGY